MVRVAVTDRGMGILAEALTQLFTRFYRAPNAEAQPITGLGVGLYVAREDRPAAQRRDASREPGRRGQYFHCMAAGDAS